MRHSNSSNHQYGAGKKPLRSNSELSRLRPPKGKQTSSLGQIFLEQAIAALESHGNVVPQSVSFEGSINAGTNTTRIFFDVSTNFRQRQELEVTFNWRDRDMKKRFSTSIGVTCMGPGLSGETERAYTFDRAFAMLYKAIEQVAKDNDSPEAVITARTFCNVRLAPHQSWPLKEQELLYIKFTQDVEEYIRNLVANSGIGVLDRQLKFDYVDTRGQLLTSSKELDIPFGRDGVIERIVEIKATTSPNMIEKSARKQLEDQLRLAETLSPSVTGILLVVDLKNLIKAHGNIGAVDPLNVGEFVAKITAPQDERLRVVRVDGIPVWHSMQQKSPTYSLPELQNAFHDYIADVMVDSFWGL